MQEVKEITVNPAEPVLQTDPSAREQRKNFNNI